MLPRCKLCGRSIGPAVGYTQATNGGLICDDCGQRLHDEAEAARMTPDDDEDSVLEPTPLSEQDGVPTYTVPDEHGPDLGGEG